MDQHQNQRIKKVLECDTLLLFLQNSFKEVNGSRVINIKTWIRNVLVKYDKIAKNDKISKTQDILYHNQLVESYLDDQNRSKDSSIMFGLTVVCWKTRDFRVACQLVWGAANTKLKELISFHELRVSLNSDDSYRRFAFALSMPIGKNYACFESAHFAFYDDSYRDFDLKIVMDAAFEFIEQLNAFQITDEIRLNLESSNFN
ncbi:unnamed protein product [Caenorhabditis angaria]|uniref:Uncharacterized protein n=1 Tax=Caenorhabditis angaria TaxID=860376 RepID=A0A9P1I319_9PELO|nr:unnamed protein product [Caenorhabditis angaria]